MRHSSTRFTALPLRSLVHGTFLGPCPPAQMDGLFEAVPTLAYGALGANHLWRHIRTALGLRPHDAQTESGALRTRLAVELAVWMHGEYPLDSRPLSLLADIIAPGDALAELPLAAWREMATPPPQEEHGASPCFDGPHGLFHLAAALEHAYARHDTDSAARYIAQLPANLPGRDALHARLHAEWAVVSLPASEALSVLEHMPANIFPLWRACALANVLRQIGATAQATEIYTDLWRQTLLHPNLILTLHDLAFPTKDTALPTGKDAPAIVLYSWNKTNELRATLESLHQSRTHGAPIFVLDNGSTDGTAAMLATLAAQWGEDAFQHISLPVNVGAPAARNWLLSLPEVAARDWVAFLDDDIILPADWLHPLWQATRQYPEAGAIGCAITDHTAPYTTQCAEFHLLPPDMGQRSFADMDEHVFVYANSAGLREHTLHGLTRYARPCLHVSGCCHLISTRSVRECGPFDLRFTPSQFDDLERDMRIGLAGFSTIYTGHTTIRHMQHSSLRQASTPARTGHIFGNKIKLEHIHSARQTTTLRSMVDRQVRDDLHRKAALLRSLLTHNPGFAPHA